MNLGTLYGMPVIKVPLYKTVQKRKHNSKRINKKWLKRYGYKTTQLRPKMNEYYIAMGNIFIPEEIWSSFESMIKYQNIGGNYEK